jgi:site-specific recombinase XerD
LIVTSQQENEQFMRTLAQKYQEEGIKQVAINMLLEHLDIDTVQKFTKLNKGIIQNLLNDLKNVRESQTK